MNSPLMSNTIDKYIIIRFSIVSKPYPCHAYLFITENCSSKFTITSFWATALKPPAENGIPKNLWIRHRVVPKFMFIQITKLQADTVMSWILKIEFSLGLMKLEILFLN